MNLLNPLKKTEGCVEKLCKNEHNAPLKEVCMIQYKFQSYYIKKVWSVFATISL